MPLITFLSDFGLQEHYVAVVKAAIFKELPQQTILDISHDVKMGNIVQAAYLLKSVIQECEKGTIHIVAVGTTLAQEQLLVKYKEQYFLGPNNGIFSICFKDEPDTAEFYELPKMQIPTSFPTKESYTKAAIKLIKQGFFELNKKENIIEKISRTPIVQQDTATAHIIYVEKHGNLITNIKKDFFEEFTKDKRFTIAFEYEKIKQISNSYQDVEYGDCVVFFNSNGLMEIAINHGNAAELLGMKYDSIIKIICTSS